MTGPERIAHNETLPASPDLDPDPRVPSSFMEPTEDELVEQWMHELATPSSRLLGLVAAAASGALVGLLAGFLLASGVIAASPTASGVWGLQARSEASHVLGQHDDRESAAPVVVSSRGGASPSPAVGSHPILDVPIESMPATSDTGTALEGGIATWYRDPSRSGNYAAAPWWRWGDPIERVTVCNRAGACVRVVVGDNCGCPGNRIIDLAPAAFRKLAPLSAGIVAVTVERGGVSVTPPPTSTEP